MFKYLLPLALAVTTLSSPAPATAAGSSTNEVTSSFELNDDLWWHRYDTGPRLDSEPSLADTFANTAQNTTTPSVVELEQFIEPSAAPDTATVEWYDTDLRARQCVSVTGSVRRFVDISFDSTSPTGWEASGFVQANWGDVIAIVDDGTTVSTPPFWLATPFDTVDGHLVVEVDFSAVDSPAEVCMYFGSEAGGLVSGSSSQLGMNWGTMEPLYTRNNPLTNDPISISNPTLSPVRVATSATGPFTTIAAGGVISYAMGAQDVLFADGAVQTRGPNATNDDDSLVPVSFSSDTFVSRANRWDQRWCFGNTPSGTVITIDPSSGPAVNHTYTPADPCASVDTTAATVLTASTPFNLFHTATLSTMTQRIDNHVVYPPSSEWLYGVASRNHYVATDVAGTTVLRERSDGTSSTHTIGANGASIGGSASQGEGPSERILSTGAGNIASIQIADSDGSETTSFLPLAELSSRYVINRTAQYVAFACPQAGQQLLVGGVARTCAGTGMGHLRETNVPAGTVIESVDGAAFFIYAEVSNDETNYFTPRIDWEPVSATTRPVEALYDPTGTWTVVASAMTEVWGLIEFDDTVPTDTTLTWRMACGPAAIGPWTVLVAVADGDAVPHQCDGMGFVQYVGSFATADRTITPQSVDLLTEHTLVREPSSTASFDLSVTGNTWMWRVHDYGTTYGTELTNIVDAGGSSSGNYVLVLVDDAMVDSSQIVASGGGVVDGGGADVVLDVSSIRAEVIAVPAATDEYRWQIVAGPPISRLIEVF